MVENREPVPDRVRVMHVVGNEDHPDAPVVGQMIVGALKGHDPGRRFDLTEAQSLIKKTDPTRPTTKAY
jgi:hypothetical protein